MTERAKIVLSKKDEVGELKSSIKIEMDFPYTHVQIAFNFVREKLGVWEKKDD
ncbi:hypothetical protein LCGC14_1599970 [marine sediment metagenome]|uniref:Uncharacterized protein n=1 Tax=marine sediment metagenome TaxID=412755 RepID=A0A0F9IBS0_9ZZZZ